MQNNELKKKLIEELKQVVSNYFVEALPDSASAADKKALAAAAAEKVVAKKGISEILEAEKKVLSNQLAESVKSHPLFKKCQGECSDEALKAAADKAAKAFNNMGKRVESSLEATPDKLPARAKRPTRSVIKVKR